MGIIFNWLDFLATSTGLAAMGVLMAAVIIAWEWRLALAGLLVLQLGIGAATVSRQELPVEWAGIMVGVTGLSAVILALSARRIRTHTSLYQSGTWPQRALLVALVYVSWRLLGWRIPLPEFGPELSDLFLWLGLCVLIILGMGENPLFTGLALLIWLIPAQAITAVILEIPALMALIGMIQLMAALACSYLVLVEEPPAEEVPVVTDITFPSAEAPRLAVIPLQRARAVRTPVAWLQTLLPSHGGSAKPTAAAPPSDFAAANERDTDDDGERDDLAPKMDRP